MNAKECDRESRQDMWFENRLVIKFDVVFYKCQHPIGDGMYCQCALIKFRKFLYKMVLCY